MACAILGPSVLIWFFCGELPGQISDIPYSLPQCGVPYYPASPKKAGGSQGFANCNVNCNFFFSFCACLSYGFRVRFPLGPLGRICLIAGLRYLSPNIHLPCPHFLWDPSLTQLSNCLPPSLHFSVPLVISF